MAGKNYTIEHREPLVLKKIYINSTKVCAELKSRFFLRSSMAVSHPYVLSEAGDVANGTGLNYVVTNKEKNASAQINMEEMDDRIALSFEASLNEPVWMFEWKLAGFEFDEVIIPALGGQKLTSGMPEGQKLTFKYPFWWNAQFVIGIKENRGFLISTRDSSTQLKMLKIEKENGKFSVTFGFEARAPFNSNKLKGEWYIFPFEGSWKTGVDIHREWAEQNMHLPPFEQKPNFPGWAQKVNIVLELWGANRDNTVPKHSFIQMAERLEEWKKLHDPAQTLLYLPGFAEYGIDTNAPDYNPSLQCGGEEEFGRLIDKAHEMGFKVMIHTNTLAMTFNHRKYKEFEKYRVIDGFGQAVSWGMDIDGDWLSEPFFAYMNPGYEAWTDYFISVIRGLKDKFDIDGVFLDQTLLAFNVSQGPDFVEGMKKHVAKINAAFPELLIAGEGMHEHIAGVLPAAQVHGIDSLTNIHSLEVKAPWKLPHKVSAYYFGKYVRYLAHLLTQHPEKPEFAIQEKIYEELNIIPALCLYSHSQKLDIPETRKMIKRAKSLTYERYT